MEVAVASSGGAVSKVRPREVYSGLMHVREDDDMQPLYVREEERSVHGLSEEPEAGDSDSVRSASSGVGSLSSYAGYESMAGEVTTVRDPMELLRGVIDCQVSAKDAAGVLVSYYGAVAATATGCASTTSSTRSYSQRRKERLDRWNAKVSAMPEPSGQCYLHVIRPSRRAAVLHALGRFPTLQEFIGVLEPRDLADQLARSFGLYRLGGLDVLPVQYHVSQEPVAGAVLVGTMHQVVATVLRMFPSFNKRGYECEGECEYLSGVSFGTLGGRDLRVDTDCVRSDGVGGLSTAVSPTPISLEPQSAMPLGFDVADASQRHSRVQARDLEVLQRDSFEDCRCKVHQLPLTATGGSGGCFGTPGGTAPVVAAAYQGISWYCHAEPAVRQNDKRFLDYILRDDIKCAVDMPALPRSVRRYCTAQATDVETFGNGYCYLLLMRPESWWRVARLLGPNPRLDSVAVAMRAVGVQSGRLRGFVRVRDDLFHVQYVTSSVRDHVHAGVRAYTELLMLEASYPGARVGYLDSANVTIRASVRSSDVTANNYLPKEWVQFVTPAFAVLIACLSVLVAVLGLLIRITCMSRGRY